MNHRLAVVVAARGDWRDPSSTGRHSEQAQAGMEAWMRWAEMAGPAIVDMGAPLAAVTEAGTPVPAAGQIIGGYSILEAESPAALSDLLAGHPHLESGGTIEVQEMLPTPGM